MRAESKIFQLATIKLTTNLPERSRGALLRARADCETNSGHTLELADHRQQVLARGFPLGPSIRIKLFDGVPVAFASRAKPIVALM
jgi:hypothetical protein